MTVPEGVGDVRVALLPAMSGLAAVEPKWESGRIDVLIGEGQTAQVLRNLCFRLWQQQPDLWSQLVAHMQQLFSVALKPPQNIVARGEITMAYESRGATLDLSSAGRGQQQILLLLAYVLANPGTTLLLDEPDAHLEVVRQRETYNLLSELVHRYGSQIIAASHSEVVLEEASRKDTLVAFVGQPHRIDDRGSQVRKWLADDPIDHFYQAAMFDRLDRTPRDLGVETLVWLRREIENYMTRRDVLEAWAMGEEPDTLFGRGRVNVMQDAITEIESAQRSLGRDIWSADIKATDDVLDPIFRRYYTETKQPLLFRKADYHRLVHRFHETDPLWGSPAHRCML